MVTASVRIALVRAAARRKPHGTRARYVSGKCKCPLCRAANCRYNRERDRLRKEGDVRNIVSAEAARDHIAKLAAEGIGYREVVASSGVAKSIVLAIKNGSRSRIRANTERAILAVEPKPQGDNSLIPAAPTWRILNELIGRGFSRAQLGRWLGYKHPSIQFNKHRIIAKTAMRVERLNNLLAAGMHRN